MRARPPGRANRKGCCIKLEIFSLDFPSIIIHQTYAISRAQFLARNIGVKNPGRRSPRAAAEAITLAGAFSSTHRLMRGSVVGFTASAKIIEGIRYGVGVLKVLYELQNKLGFCVKITSIWTGQEDWPSSISDFFPMYMLLKALGLHPYSILKTLLK